MTDSSPTLRTNLPEVRLAAHLYLLAVRNAGQSSLSSPSAGLGWQGPGDDAMLRGWARLSLKEREEFIVVAKSILLHLSECEGAGSKALAKPDVPAERPATPDVPAKRPAAPVLAPCPTCDGRKAGLFDSLCKKHFEALEGPSVEAIEEAMEKGRKAAEAYRKSRRNGWKVW
jgi:hypothetical protein